MRRIALILCGLLLVTCGAQPGQAPPATVAVTASEFRFTPATLALTAGQPTTLLFKNGGQTLHNFKIVSGPGVPTPAATAGDEPSADAGPYYVAAEAGRQATLTLTLTSGTYTFICTVQGHRDLGMQGTLTVR
jgi:uncharacterized cupredoxin-like copper-binding protein